MEECYRGSEVRVFRLDRDGVLLRLRQKASELLRERTDIAAVYLFGSLARGQAVPGSDADLFIVLRESAAPFLERVADLSRYFSGVGIGCDVIAYTEDELAQLQRSEDRFVGVVLGEGLRLAPTPSSTTTIS